jgi:hypothetical protein
MNSWSISTKEIILNLQIPQLRGSLRDIKVKELDCSGYELLAKTRAYNLTVVIH